MEVSGAVDIQATGIALMKQQEQMLQTYFNEVFCTRSFELLLGNYLDDDYTAFLTPKTERGEGKAATGVSMLAPVLMKITEELEGKESSVSNFVAYPLDEEDKAQAFAFAKEQSAAGQEAFNFMMMDMVCDWLCKCSIQLSTGQHYYKLWMFSPASGKLCCSWNLTELPERIFKLAVAAELEAFKVAGTICSSLDAADGFVHLSNSESARVVAKNFFAEADDLHLLEVDVAKLAGEVTWVVGAMGDPAPPLPESGNTTVHYLLPDGCVHIYCDAGLGMAAVTREAAVPLGEGRAHEFPSWLT